MALDQKGIYLLVGVFTLLCAWVDAQAFLPEEDGTILSIGVPNTLSTACHEVLADICTDSCKESLQSFRSQEVEACGDKDYQIDGQLVPATYGVD
ncbi:hypothetical protein N7507_003333 [Penicillium longicatenatum]|nr:hypothetical protein N7507_003333 [Penicillium longicatenatum]